MPKAPKDQTCGEEDPRHPGWTCHRWKCNGEHRYTAGPMPAYPPFGSKPLDVEGGSA